MPRPAFLPSHNGWQFVAQVQAEQLAQAAATLAAAKAAQSSAAATLAAAKAVARRDAAEAAAKEQQAELVRTVAEHEDALHHLRSAAAVTRRWRRPSRRWARRTRRRLASCAEGWG